MRSRTKPLLACLLGVALAVPAIAQSGSVTQYPSCPDPPPKLSRAELEAAGAAYHVGVEAFDNGDYRKALDNIKDALRRDCSKVSLLLQLAQIYAALGDRPEAIHALETYLQRNPKAGDAETVQNRIQNLRALMQQQTTASASTTTTATTTATAPTTTATATAVPTGTATAPQESGGHTAGPWIVVGVGVAAAIAGGVMIGVGQSEFDNARAGCTFSGGTATCPPLPGKDQKSSDTARASQENDGLTIRGAGIAVTTVGAAALITGLIWHFAEPTGPKATAFIPVVAPGYAGMSYNVRF